MSDIECPYCGAAEEICHEDGYGYEEDRMHEQECGHCGKTFVFTTCISFDYDVSCADCLNGGEHTWESVCHVPKLYPDWKRCRDCGKEDRGKRLPIECPV